MQYSNTLYCIKDSSEGFTMNSQRGQKIMLNHFGLVSSTPFGIPFHLPVPFYNRGSSLFIICKRLVHKDFSIISASFQNLYDVINKSVVFTLTSFALPKWNDCLWVQVPFELLVQIRVQFLLELKANWLNQNVNELEFELSRM